MKHRGVPVLTPLQYAFLASLVDGNRTADEMRTWLEPRAAFSGTNAFYEVIHRLKNHGFLKAAKAMKATAEHSASAYSYELTDEGREAVAVFQDFYDEVLEKRRARPPTIARKRVRDRSW